MHAIFVVHCWVNLKPLNRTKPANLQLCSSQLINQNSWFGVRGTPKNTFALSPHICRSVPDWNHSSFDSCIFPLSGKHGSL